MKYFKIICILFFLLPAIGVAENNPRMLTLKFEKPNKDSLELDLHILNAYNESCFCLDGIKQILTLNGTEQIELFQKNWACQSIMPYQVYITRSDERWRWRPIGETMARAGDICTISPPSYLWGVRDLGENVNISCRQP